MDAHKTFARYEPLVRGLAQQSIDVIEYYCRMPERINLQETWAGRAARGLGGPSKRGGSKPAAVTKIEKLARSLEYRARQLPLQPEERKAFVSDIMAFIERAWRETPLPNRRSARKRAGRPKKRKSPP